MRMSWYRPTLVLALAMATAGCAGEAPPAQERPDAAVAFGQQLTGTTLDYFRGTPLADTEITTDGIDPPASTTSSADGGYTLEGLPVGSQIVLTATHAGYRTTRNPRLAIVGDASQDVLLMSEADVSKQYSLAARIPTSGTAIAIVDLVDDAGQPLEQVTATDIRLVDAGGQTVAIDPVFCGADGNADLNLATATAFAGRSRVALLDIPPGTYAIEASFSSAGGSRLTARATIVATADGAALAIAKP
jgi:hypothetical protein